MKNKDHRFLLVEAFRTQTHDSVTLGIAKVLKVKCLSNYSGVLRYHIKKIKLYQYHVIFLLYLQLLYLILFKKRDIRSLNYKGVNIGHPINEEHLRFSRLARFSCNLRSVNLVAKSVFYVDRLNSFIDRYGPCYIIGGDEAYTFSSILCQIGMSRGCKVKCLKGSSKVSLVDYCNRYLTGYSYFEDLRSEQVDDVGLNEATQELSRRVKGIRTDLAYMDHYLQESIELSEKSVIIYAHDFYDAPGIYGGNCFPSHFDWVTETIRYCLHKHIPVMVKLHPNSRPESDCINNHLASRYKNVRFVTSDFSPSSLKRSGSVIVTVYGSVILEALFSGLELVVAGRHPYCSFIEVCYPTNPSEYFKTLEKKFFSDGASQSLELSEKEHLAATALASFKRYRNRTIQIDDCPLDDIDRDQWDYCDLGPWIGNVFDRRAKFLKNLDVGEYVRKRIQRLDIATVESFFD